MASFLSLYFPKLNLIKASSASSTTSTTTTTLPTPEVLNEKFGRKGIKFLESDIVELTIRNGSSLSLSIPDAHVTSYKPKVYGKMMPLWRLLHGRELFFRVIRMGFEDIYVSSSPGSLSEKYGKDYFIYTGPASILVPVTVNPGEECRGAQVIEHDNLT